MPGAPGRIRTYAPASGERICQLSSPVESRPVPLRTGWNPLQVKDSWSRERRATHRQKWWVKTAGGNKTITVRTFRLGDVRDLLIEAERRRTS